MDLSALAGSTWWVIQSHSSVGETYAKRLRVRGARVRTLLSFREAVTAIQALNDDNQRPDGAIVDLGLDDGDGDRLIRLLSNPRLFSPCLVLTEEVTDYHLQRALHNGCYRIARNPVATSDFYSLCVGMLAWGVERKHHITDVMKACGCIVAEKVSTPPGWQSLSAAERQLAHIIAAGAFRQELKGMRGVTENTIKVQLSALYRKLGAASYPELARHLRGLRLHE